MTEDTLETLNKLSPDEYEAVYKFYGAKRLDECDYLTKYNSADDFINDQFDGAYNELISQLKSKTIVVVADDLMNHENEFMYDSENTFEPVIFRLVD